MASRFFGYRLRFLPLMLITTSLVFSGDKEIAMQPTGFHVFNQLEFEHLETPREAIDSIRAAYPFPEAKSSTDRAAMYPSLIWPCAETLYDGQILGNYVDHAGSGTILDYMGGTHAYDGHTGTDFGPTGFRDMDRGVPILAAADGVVTALEYRRTDRNIEYPYPDNGNYIIIRHYDGTEGLYWHFRQNSVTVSLGDTVQAGDVIGLMGSSGYSTDVHLHFALEHNSSVRDPWDGPYNSQPGLWIDQPPYVGDTAIISDMDVFTETAAGGDLWDIPWRLIKEELMHPAVFGIDETYISLWLRLQGAAGDSYRIEIRRPNNTLYTSLDHTFGGKTLGWHIWIWGWSGYVSPSYYGTWTAKALIGGVTQQEVQFEVNATTIYGPRFWPVAGKSLRASNKVQTDVLRVWDLCGPVTYSLVNPPDFVSLIHDSVIQVTSDLGRSHDYMEFKAVATDGYGYTDTMHYHLVMDIGNLWLADYAFSDAVYGDGDGIPEAGETIQLTVDLSNYYADELTGVSAELTIDDASLRILDGQANYGNIASQSTATNNGDPFEFTIPAGYMHRLDSFYIDISWDGGAERDIKAFEQPIGEITILHVDDDAGIASDTFITRSFINIRVPCDTFTTAIAGTPGIAMLNDYDIVVWSTGDYQAQPLTTNEVTALIGYMDNGGKLFLTGQGIAAQLDTENPSFLANYLRSEYLSSSLIPILNGKTGAPVFGGASTIVIQGSDGADNQTNPDQIDTINGGISEMDYYGTTDLGGVSYDGAYQLVFCGFGLEGVVNNNSGWFSRDSVLARVLGFFNHSLPGCLLSADFGEPVEHLTSHTPTISWDECGVAIPDQQMYHIQVGTDDEWATAEQWDSGPVSESNNSAVYDGLPLLDGHTYFCRLKYQDAVDWTAWHYYQFRMNNHPTAPDNLTPSGMQELEIQTPTLTHDNATDGDGDILTYSYELYDDEGLTMLIDQENDLPEDVGATSSWQSSEILDFGDDYYWRVRAHDGYEYGDWSQTASFQVIQPYICGDANDDETLNVGDAVHLINYVFKSGPAPNPLCVGDADGDTAVNVGDAVHMINYVFKSGPPPVEPCCP